MNRTLKYVVAAIAIRQVRRTVKMRRDLRQVQRTLDREAEQHEASLRADGVRSYTSEVQRAWGRVDAALTATRTTPEERAAAANLSAAERDAIADAGLVRWTAARRELSGFETRLTALTPPPQFARSHGDVIAATAAMGQALDTMIAGMTDGKASAVKSGGADYAAAGEHLRAAVAAMTRSI